MGVLGAGRAVIGSDALLGGEAAGRAATGYEGYEVPVELQHETQSFVQCVLMRAWR